MLISSNEIERSKQEGVKYLVVICATIIAVGVLLFIVGFMGCCGAAFENQCLLGTVSTIIIFKKKSIDDLNKYFLTFFTVYLLHGSCIGCRYCWSSFDRRSET